MAGACLCSPFVFLVNLVLRWFRRDADGYTELSTRGASDETQTLVESTAGESTLAEGGMMEDSTYSIPIIGSGINSAFYFFIYQ